MGSGPDLRALPFKFCHTAFLNYIKQQKYKGTKSEITIDKRRTMQMNLFRKHAQAQ